MKYELRKDFEFAAASLRLSDKQLCSAIGVPYATMMQAFHAPMEANANLLESFYSFAYQSGLRLNHSKEELMREIYGPQLYFHGSRSGVTSLSPNGSRTDCDFGSGFYLGERFEQAAAFVCDSAFGSVYAYALDISALHGAHLKCDMEWMLLICYFRGKLKQYEAHPYLRSILSKIEGADYIVAPIADNRMFQVMRQFGDGEISADEAIHALSASSLGEQTVLKSQKAVDSLKGLRRMYVSSPEKKRFLSLSEERAKEIDTKLWMAKREFHGAGGYIDEVLSL